MASIVHNDHEIAFFSLVTIHLIIEGTAVLMHSLSSFFKDLTKKLPCLQRVWINKKGKKYIYENNLEAYKDFDACIGTKINHKCHQIKTILHAFW